MKKILSVLTSKWAYAVYAAILAFLASFQEIALGNEVVAWIMGLAVAVGFGMIAEAFRKVINYDKYILKNVLPWLIGGVVGCLIAYLFV